MKYKLFITRGSDGQYIGWFPELENICSVCRDKESLREKIIPRAKNFLAEYYKKYHSLPEIKETTILLQDVEVNEDLKDILILLDMSTKISN